MKNRYSLSLIKDLRITNFVRISGIASNIPWLPRKLPARLSVSQSTRDSTSPVLPLALPRGIFSFVVQYEQVKQHHVMFGYFRPFDDRAGKRKMK